MFSKACCRRCAPASIRLVDNPQFQFGMALKPEAGSFFHKVVDAAKKFFLLKIKGFEVDKMVLMTVMMEGDAAKVRHSLPEVSFCNTSCRCSGSRQTSWPFALITGA